MTAPEGPGLADYKFTKLPLGKISIFAARKTSFLTSVQKPIWLGTCYRFWLTISTNSQTMLQGGQFSVAETGYLVRIFHPSV